MRLKYIFYFCGLSLLLGSCSDFLEETPQTVVSSEGVYNTLPSARASLAGCYASMADYNYTGFNFFHVLNVTSGVGVSIKANDVTLTTLKVSPSNVNLTNAFNGMYRTVMASNDIIEGISESSLPESDERNRIEGEARFIRALTYFNLVRMFGEVPLVSKPVTSFDEAHTGRCPIDDVYALIESDLTSAYEHLLPDPENALIGYPHKYAAQALLAKVYITRAGVDESSPYWQKAYNCALDVYENGGYQLVRPYANLFGSPNKNNAESIFEVQFSASVNSGRTTETTFPVGHELMSNIATQGKSWGKTLPTQQAYNQFDEGDPRRSVSFVSESYTNIFETNAKKKVVTLYPTTKKQGNQKGWTYSQGNSEYPAWKKYYDPMMTASASNTNFVFFRYADLLLILAEAANEIGSPDAATYLNMVLDRARDANGNGSIESDEVYPLAYDGGSKENLRERILRERLKEFTGECDEWFTIRRKGVDFLRTILEEHNNFIDGWYAAQKITTLPKYVYQYEISDEMLKRNMLFPIPADEINTNQNIGLNDQNYGY